MKPTESAPKSAASVLAGRILASAKYRRLRLPPETVESIVANELADGWKGSPLEQRVREKLHHLAATYLGDLNAPLVYSQLGENADLDDFRPICAEVLRQHASTRERLEILNDFYPRLFDITGQPGVILDLACGLNPFSLPWVPAAKTIEFHAYDIVLPRLAQIDAFFKQAGLRGATHHQDILLQPPAEEADVAFLFKEIHRMEDRQKGAALRMLSQLKAKWLLISLPTRNLTGTRSLLEIHRRLMQSVLSAVNWQVTEILFENEIVFAIRK